MKTQLGKINQKTTTFGGVRQRLGKGQNMVGRLWTKTFKHEWGEGGAEGGRGVWKRNKNKTTGGIEKLVLTEIQGAEPTKGMPVE